MAIRCRRNIYNLNAQELTKLQTAVRTVKTSGIYDDLVKSHARAMNNRTLLPGETPATQMRNSAHRGPAFLPWHRHYIRKFEQALQASDPDVMLPYWPWEKDGDLADPNTATILTTPYMGAGTALAPPNESYSIIDDGPSAGWQVFRTLLQIIPNPSPPPPTIVDGFAMDASGGLQFHFSADPFPPNTTDDFGGFDGLLRRVGRKPIRDSAGNVIGFTELPTSVDVADCLTYTQYDDEPWDVSVSGDSATGSFRNLLEGWVSSSLGVGLHNAVHVWVGGDMGPGTSPNDPIFYLNHCNVDRIWAKWQELQRFQTGHGYSAAYLPVSDGPTGHNIDDSLFPWETEGLTPRKALDYSREMGFIYDDIPLVELSSKELTFREVAAGETQVREVYFQVTSFYGIHFGIDQAASDVGAGKPFSAPQGTSIDVITDPNTLSGSGRILIGHTGQADGASVSGALKINGELRDAGGTVLWTRAYDIPLRVNP